VNNDGPDANRVGGTLVLKLATDFNPRTIEVMRQRIVKLQKSEATVVT
jgi:hypothetical protein